MIYSTEDYISMLEIDNNGNFVVYSFEDIRTSKRCVGFENIYFRNKKEAEEYAATIQQNYKDKNYGKFIAAIKSYSFKNIPKTINWEETQKGEYWVFDKCPGAVFVFWNECNK